MMTNEERIKILKKRMEDTLEDYKFYRQESDRRILDERIEAYMIMINDDFAEKEYKFRFETLEGK